MGNRVYPEAMVDRAEREATRREAIQALTANIIKDITPPVTAPYRTPTEDNSKSVIKPTTMG